MDLPKNRFKAALKEGRHQLGLWNMIGGNTAPEVAAVAGFDWVVIDTEHAPVEATEVLPALQAISAFPNVTPVVRPDSNDTVLIKRYLDMGAQTLVIPYVQSAEEAAAAVAAMRYPPDGIRGMAGFTRAARYGKVADYATRANDEMCLIVQVETAEALDRLEDISTVEGVDGVFIGPADLSASMGFPGNAGVPEVKAAIAGAFERLRKVGVPSGILATDVTAAREWMDLGTGFTAVGVDLFLLANAVYALRAEFD